MNKANPSKAAKKFQAKEETMVNKDIIATDIAATQLNQINFLV